MKKPLEAVLRQFHENLEEQQRIIEASLTKREDFLAAFDSYRNEQLLAKCLDTNAYRRILARSDLSEDETEAMMARFLESRNRPPPSKHQLAGLFSRYAANLERQTALQRDSGLLPEEIGDAYREHLWNLRFSSKGESPPHVTLETANSLPELVAIFRRHGVLWWWKLKRGEFWNSHFLVETISQNGCEYRFARQFTMLFRYRYERSAFNYELLARHTAKGAEPQFEFGKPWCALTRKQMDGLTRRWPMPQGNLIPYLWRACSNPHEPKEEMEWPNECVLRNHAFDLRASNAALMAEFKKIISFERERLGIHQTPRKGHPTKSKPWSLFQAMDLRKYEHGKPLDEGQRSLQSKALKDTERP
jgi:hypothetical protein